ncbi:LCP family protein [Nocardioides sp. InS609-2]|uniref:LCP family protein n=1 Tax=Nocardioides sp. InS609-2 TaxID=2760705 RepID=UPI0020C059B0|nr:LCP family protein [Nocardioides sp. InS609-2]
MSETETDESSERPAAPKRRGRVKKKHTVGYVLLSSLVVLALVTGLAVVFLYRSLNGNLNVVDVMGEVDNSPDKVKVEGPKQPINVLVMGSDTREGEGNQIDGESGAAGSDTTILFHLSADRTRAYGVSIPRDSLVTRPDCGKDNEIEGGTDQMWNAAYSLGEQACTIEQFQELTDIAIDHYVVLDFNGFRDMVDAIDGVPVCIPEDIEDPEHNISIPRGKRDIKGAEALSYVRVRYDVGDGSDISRISRQQTFIAAMAKKVISGGTLTRPDRLIGFLRAVTRSLTVDPGLKNLSKIGGLGVQFQSIGLDNIQFLTVPFAYDQREEFSGRVVWLPEADSLWRKLRNDEPLSKRLTSGAIDAANAPGQGESPSDTESPSSTESPSETTSPSAPQSPTAEETEQAAEDAAANGLCA